MHRAYWIAMFAAVLATPSLARADDRETARAEFAQGKAADARHEWAVALAHYEKANELVEHPFTIYNIAADYEHLGKLREAGTWYARYLELATDQADVGRVRAHLQQITLKPGPITIESTPPGAVIHIDRVPSGRTPVTMVEPGGAHEVAIEFGGHREVRQIDVEFGEAQLVTFDLHVGGGPSEPRPESPYADPSATPPSVTAGRAPPERTALLITGTPVGATVAVDGAIAGSVPVRVAVAPGPHAIVATAPGFTTREQHADAIADTVTPVSIALGPDASQGATPGYELALDGGYSAAYNAQYGPLFRIEYAYAVSHFELGGTLGYALGGYEYGAIARLFASDGSFSPYVVGEAFVAESSDPSADDDSGVSTHGGYGGGVGFRYLLKPGRPTSYVRAQVEALAQASGGVVFPITIGLEFRYAQPRH